MQKNDIDDLHTKAAELKKELEETRTLLDNLQKDKGKALRCNDL